MTDGDLISMLFFGAIAVFVIFRLKSSLGEHNETDVNGPGVMRNFDVTQQEKQDNVVNLSPSEVVEAENFQDLTRDTEILEKLDKPVRETLETLTAKDKFFTVSSFLEGAKYAFEMIVDAHAKGDLKTLKDLLSPELFKHFEEDIKGREARKEKLAITLVAVKEPKITKAEIQGKIARITAHFTSEQMRASSVINKVQDIWTFERTVGASNPNWTLVETGTV
jgi:predicted lipid-binding transport protein (Tim44 family)